MVQWVSDNWMGIAAAVLAFDGLLFAVTKLTPTIKDDNIYAMIHKYVMKFFQKTP